VSLPNCVFGLTKRNIYINICFDSIVEVVAAENSNYFVCTDLYVKYREDFFNCSSTLDEDLKTDNIEYEVFHVLVKPAALKMKKNSEELYMSNYYVRKKNFYYNAMFNTNL
jgi:hypothetical protein